MKIEWISPAELKPYDKNARDNAAAIKEVVKSLREFGWQQPIVVDNNRVVVAGHTRLAAAKVLEMQSVPIKYAEELTAAQVKAYRLMDNRSSDFSTWKNELVLEELADILNISETLNAEFIGFNIESLLDTDHGNFKLESGDDRELVEILIKCFPQHKATVIQAMNDLPFDVTYEVQNVREKI